MILQNVSNFQRHEGGGLTSGLCMRRRAGRPSSLSRWTAIPEILVSSETERAPKWHPTHNDSVVKLA